MRFSCCLHVIAVWLAAAAGLSQETNVESESTVAHPVRLQAPKPAHNCIPPAIRRQIEARAARNLETLRAANALPPPTPTRGRYRFFPQAGTLWRDIFPNNFIDLAPGPGIVDWNGTDYTYDGHDGIDSGLVTFGQQSIGVPIIAALDGVVIDAHDGEEDMRTGFDPSYRANYVILAHQGTHQTWYYHLKRNSVAVSVGQNVVAGQQLGLTASSGYSTGPHLHFESRYAGAAYESFTGPANPGVSGWVAQPPFDSSFTVRQFVVTPDDLTNWEGPPIDTARTGTRPSGTQTVRFWVSLTNQPAGSTYRFRYLRPNGTARFDSGTQSFGGNPFYRQPTWWWTRTINFDVTGEWTIEWSLNGTVYVRAPLRIGTATNNRPPFATTASFDPATPTPDDTIFCRVPSVPIADPDYSVGRYRFDWRRNGSLIRTSTNASTADAIPRSTCVEGDTLTCTVTPTDGTADGTPTVVSYTFPSTPAEIAVEHPVGTSVIDGDSRGFGSATLGSSAAQTFTLRNTGTADLTGLAFSVDGANAGDFTPSTLAGGTLAPGMATTFTITFAPSAGGVRTAALHVASNDADENPFDIQLFGTGSVPAGAEITVEQPAGTGIASGGSRAFGTVTIGAVSTLTFTVRNLGAANLTGLAITKDGAQAGDFTVGALSSTTLAQNASTTFTVTFAPAATGSRAATLHLASNDADENPFDIALSGSGRLPSALNFAGSVVHDGDGIGGIGDGSGLINPGEEIDLGVDLRNDDAASVTGITATLGCSSAFVSIDDATETWSDIPGGATRRSSADFDFTVSAAAPPGTSLDFTLALTTAQGNYSRSFSLTVFSPGTSLLAPDLLIGSSTTNLLGNGIYNLDASGQTFPAVVKRKKRKTFVLKVENDGIAAQSFRLTGQSDTRSYQVKVKDGAANITSSLFSTGHELGELAPGESRFFTVKVTAGARVGRNAFAHCTFQISRNSDGVFRDVAKLAVTPR